ncbi:branched-chain amino acid ABC transporter permease [Pararhodobacter zhoushanensis]|uniref:branched-chain amino acid ABC transporter permease n=1 Tax=Pararhodobacter zhoushanensis TaxID=2479545 RepID=UPI001C700D29|nr:branched-chain amino acid ABC transporter permease [Pararhodobacter zhoushanensis]
MSKRMLALIAAVLVLAALPVVFPFTRFMLTLAIAKGFAALGVALLLRAGLISLGHAMYFGLGAYAVAFLSAKAGISDFFVGLIAAAVVSGVAGLIFGAFLVRYRAIFFAMLNLAVSMVLYSLFSKLYGLTGGTDGLRVGVPSFLGWEPARQTFEGVLFFACLILMLGAGWLGHRYLQSPMGQALSAIHTNELRLEYLGVSAWATLLSAYSVSAMLAGIGGALTAMAVGHVLPEYLYWTQSGHLVLTAVLGGFSAVAGPFIGSITLEGIHTLAVGYAAEAWNLIVGAALLGVIFFLPNGIVGLLRGRRAAKAEEVL